MERKKDLRRRVSAWQEGYKDERKALLESRQANRELRDDIATVSALLATMPEFDGYVSGGLGKPTVDFAALADDLRRDAADSARAARLGPLAGEVAS